MGNLNEKIKKVNKVLLGGEPKNISADLQNGQVGYQIQNILDAMNLVFGTEGWSFEFTDWEIRQGKKKEVVAVGVSVKFYLKIATGEWVGRKAIGQAEIEHDNYGDAKKAAVADGLKKALAYASIGNRAYLGELEKLVAANPDAPAAGIVKQDFKCERCEVEHLTEAEMQFSKQVYGRILGRDCQLKVNRRNQKQNGKLRRSNIRKKARK